MSQGNQMGKILSNWIKNVTQQNNVTGKPDGKDALELNSKSHKKWCHRETRWEFWVPLYLSGGEASEHKCLSKIIHRDYDQMGKKCFQIA